VTENEIVLKYQYRVKKEKLENPDTIDCLTVTLPQGMSAKFRRWTTWEPDHPIIEESGANEPPSVSLAIS